MDELERVFWKKKGMNEWLEVGTFVEAHLEADFAGGAYITLSVLLGEVNDKAIEILIGMGAFRGPGPHEYLFVFGGSPHESSGIIRFQDTIIQYPHGYHEIMNTERGTVLMIQPKPSHIIMEPIE